MSQVGHIQVLIVLGSPALVLVVVHLVLLVGVGVVLLVIVIIVLGWVVVEQTVLVVCPVGPDILPLLMIGVVGVVDINTVVTC